MHSIWDLWISGIQKCKDNNFFEVGRAGNSFRSDPEYLKFLGGRLPLPESASSISSMGYFSVPQTYSPPDFAGEITNYNRSQVATKTFAEGFSHIS